jgi:hypothetical protein
MNSEDAAIAVIDALESLAVPYMLVGSFSSNFYGIPRATHDADFVVQLREGQVRALAQSLGPAFRLDPQMSFESVTGTTRYTIRLADTPFEVELFSLSDDDYDRQRFLRRRRVWLRNRETFLPSAEDVIITKLRWSRGGRRGKDVDDARNVIAVQGARIDWDYVGSWCGRHGTRDLLESVRSSIPKE